MKELVIKKEYDHENKLFKCGKRHIEQLRECSP